MHATRSSRLHRLGVLAACVGLALGTAASARGATGTVSVLRATGVVDSVMAGYIAEGVAKAQREGAAAVVIELDTPGGSLEATNDIVSTLLEAPLPTIVWVAPAGGRAASAGTFITLAADVAAMAPGTSIGAASPVGSGGEDLTGTIGEKVRNDAVAKITGDRRGARAGRGLGALDGDGRALVARERGRRGRRRRLHRGVAPGGAARRRPG